MRFGSLFTGIGGFDLGFERAGMECAWQVEIDPFCQSVLQKHWPTVERFTDVKECGRHNLSAVDVICGGFPCQDISGANQLGKQGLLGERSGLWSEFHRIICEIKPRWVVVENVRELFAINAGRDFGSILRDLAGSGYDAEWTVLSSGLFGAAHLRRRVIVVAYPNGKRSSTPQIFTGQYPEIFGQGTSELDRLYIAPLKRTYRGFPPDLCIPDGLSYRVDESIKALGNAIDVRIATWIGERLIAVGAL